MRLVVGDVLAVMTDAGVERAHIVGHDWGAVVAWTLGGHAGHRVDHLVALSVGAPGAAARSFEQYEKSWYMLLFQFPRIAEAWLSGDDWANFRAWSGHPDVDGVIADLEAGGSLTPALNYYRANVPPRSLLRAAGTSRPPVAAPTMGVWSSGDFALTEGQMTGSAAAVAGPWRYERLDGPGHWMQLEAPSELNRLLLDFLPG
jgi:pimeloyl-ACP methyl ester carboxylesterase